MDIRLYGRNSMVFGSDPSWIKQKVDTQNVKYIYSILDKHKQFDFVQRIYDPSDRIKMPGTGRSGTHYMVWGETDGKYAAYPRIVRIDGELKLLESTEAWNHAKKTGEMILFDSKQDAEWFSSHYKDVWKGKFQPDGKSKRSHSKID